MTTPLSSLRRAALAALILLCVVHGTVFADAPPLLPGNLLVLNLHSGIVQVNPQTGAQSLWTGPGLLQQPQDMAFDGLGNVVVADFGSGYVGAVIRINTATGQQTQVCAGNPITQTKSVAVETNGTYLVANNGHPQFPTSPHIVRVDPNTGAETSVLYLPANPISDVQRIILDHDGSILLSNRAYPSITGGIYRVNAITGDVSTVSTGGFFNSVGAPRALAISPTNPRHLLTTVIGPNSNLNLSCLLDVDMDTGVQTMISSGGLVQIPRGLTIDELGNVFVLNCTSGTTGNIIQINPTNGAQTLISSDGLLAAPYAILAITPEPSSVALMLFAGPFLLRRRGGKPRLRYQS
jgi:hypothetical protein